MTTTPSLHITYVEELHNLTQNGQIQPRLCGQISSKLWPAGPFPGGQMGSWLDIISHCNWAEPRNNGDTVQDTANTCRPSHLSPLHQPDWLSEHQENLGLRDHWRTEGWFISGDRKEAIIRSSSYKVRLKQMVSSSRSSAGQPRPDWREKWIN